MMNHDHENIQFNHWKMAIGAGFGYISYTLFYVIGIFLANVLANPADYGNYAVTITTMLWLTTLILFGHNRYILKIYPQHRKKREYGAIHGYIRRIVQMSFIGGALIALITVATYEGYQRLYHLHHHPIIVGVLFTPIMALVLFSIEILNVNHRFILSTFINKILLPLLLAAIIVIFFFIDYISDTTAIFATGVAWTLSLVVCIFNISRLPMKSIFLAKPKYDTKKWFKSSSPYWIYQITFMSINSLPIMFLEFLHSKEILVGIFAAAFQTAAFLNLFAASSNRYILPIFSNHFDCTAFMKQILSHRRIFMLIVCTIYVIILALLGHKVLSLFGHEYTRGYPELIILLVGVYFQALFSIVPYLFQFFNMTKIMLSFQIGTLIFSIILYFILIPKFGGVGAAITFTVNILIANLLQVITFYRKTGLFV